MRPVNTMEYTDLIPFAASARFFNQGMLLP